MNNQTPQLKYPANAINAAGTFYKRLNKWAFASFATFFGGAMILSFIGLIYAAAIVLPHPIVGDQAGWNVLAFILLPVAAVQKYVPLVALVSLVLGIISIVKAKSTRTRNVLGVVMTILSALFVLQLPELISMTFGIGR